MSVFLSTSTFRAFPTDFFQAVFVQDIPKLPIPIPFNKLPKDEDFASTLAHTLKTLNVNVALSAQQKGDFPAIPLTDVAELRMSWDWCVGITIV